MAWQRETKLYEFSEDMNRGEFVNLFVNSLLMNKDVYFRFRVSFSPIFTNKTTIFLDNWLYREQLPVAKDV